LSPYLLTKYQHIHLSVGSSFILRHSIPSSFDHDQLTVPPIVPCRHNHKLYLQIMGHYNTRRISLSLPSLGVQLPRAHRPSNSSPLSDKAGLPSAKRLKRSHTLSSTPLSQAFTPPPSSPVRQHATSIIQRTLQSAVPGTNDTPPPSPPSAHQPKLDYEGINDDIVVGVLQQLEKTGNRPHLIKELATILGTSLKCVERYVQSLRCAILACRSAPLVSRLSINLLPSLIQSTLRMVSL